MTGRTPPDSASRASALNNSVVVVAVNGCDALTRHSADQSAADDQAHRPDQAAALEHATAGQHQGSVLREDTAQLSEAAVAHQVEDDVEAPAGRGDVLGRVVDDGVRAEGPHELHVAGAAHGGDVGTECLADLHGERAHPARGSVDQQPLARLEVRDVAEGLQGRAPGKGQGGCLIEGQAGGLRRHLAARCADVLGECTVGRARFAVDLVAGLHVGHAGAGLDDLAGEVAAADGGLRAAHAERAAGRAWDHRA